MKEDNTPTAEEFFKNSLVQTSIDEYGNYSIYDIEQAMVEFAKLHVEAALKTASEKGTMNLNYPEPYEDSNEIGLTYAVAEEISRGGEYGAVVIDKDSILNAYPLENIK